MEEFRRKHNANDLTIIEDFRRAVMDMKDNDSQKLLDFWNEFPNATWTRACGFMVDELVDRKKYKIAQLFWEHDMFQMGGRFRAEHLKNTFMVDV